MAHLLDRKFLIVVGKGGVGKTTVSASLGLAAARRGKRTLICMTNVKERLSHMLDVPPIGSEIVRVAPNLDVVNMDPKVALEEYGLMILKVRALYKHVITSTRYVGLEFGIHGFKPYRTTDVYDRRFGDCKDKASLLKVMLGEAGIKSHLVLVRTRDQGTIGNTPASLSAFNHAITYVPSLDLYLDGTAEFSGPEELPTGDQGATVLIVRDGAGAELRTIPDRKSVV